MSIIDLGIAGASIADQFKNKNKKGLTNLLGSATSILSGDPTGIVSGIVGKITGNLSAVFANGMDFHCWGSSWNPSKAQKEAPAMIEFILEQSGFLGSQSVDNFNRFMKYISVAIAAEPGGRDCTRKGRQKLKECYQNAKDEAIAQYANVFQLVGYNTLKKSDRYTLPFVVKPHSHKYSMKDSQDGSEIEVPEFASKFISDVLFSPSGMTGDNVNDVTNANTNNNDRGNNSGNNTDSGSFDGGISSGNSDAYSTVPQSKEGEMSGFIWLIMGLVGYYIYKNKK